ncbi:Networked 3a, partial [Thalictrum thalictroides]
MLGLRENKASHPWWFDSHNSQRRSTWLQSTLTELDEKTVTMLKLIEADADSFAQRAEMYYKKRPALVNMVEDFYRAHRSLAERFDMLKSEPRTRFMTPLTHSLSAKFQMTKAIISKEKLYDSYSESYSEAEESEVDDPEQDTETQVRKVGAGEEEESAESEVDDPKPVNRVEERGVNLVHESEVMKLRNEIERLKEENRIQKEQLMQKDEEKREVIRQLCLSLEILKENVNLCKRSTVKESSKKWGPFEFNKDTLNGPAAVAQTLGGFDWAIDWYKYRIG